MTSQPPAEDIFARAAEMVVASSFHGLATMTGDLVKAFTAANDQDSGSQMQKIADALFREHRRHRRATYLRAGIEIAKAIARKPPTAELEQWANTAIVTRIKAIRSKRELQAAFDVLGNNVHKHSATAIVGGGTPLHRNNVVPMTPREHPRCRPFKLAEEAEVS